MYLNLFEIGIFSEEPKPQVGMGMGDNPPPAAQYNFTEAEEEAIARWVESNSVLYNMKNKLYKNKALRRQLWEEKAAEYGVDCKYKKKVH